MNPFNEAHLEAACFEWLEEVGYEVLNGPDIAHDGIYPERSSYRDVVLEDRLFDALRHINPSVDSKVIEEAGRKVIANTSPNVVLNNKDFHQYVTKGIDVETLSDDGVNPTVKVYLFDFENISNNDFVAVNQFTIIQDHITKRPDVILFVNGLPLVVMELKSASSEDVSITSAYNQLQTYKKSISSLFRFNEMLIISDGVNARVGSLTANEERFMKWRTMDGQTKAENNMVQLEVMIKGMLEPSRLLDIIKNFVLFQTDGESTYKILAAYHQYFAVNKAVEKAKLASSVQGDKKIGVVWHTQGSGKSLSMVFYAGKLVQELNNPTIVVLTDRNDLDNQLFDTFSKSSEILVNTPRQAEDSTHLRELLDVQAGGVIFSTLQKFTPDSDGRMPCLTERSNVIVMADEAHRSQYGFSAHMSQAKGSAGEIKYGFAKYVRDALPNASFVGFTGTPVESTDRNTPAVFGEYIDVYDMTQAVEDGATVKIYYESRIIPLMLPDGLSIDNDYEEITESQEDTTKERLKSKWSRVAAVAGSKSRLEKLAIDIVEHFDKREAAIAGKAMAVVMSRRIAVDLYNEIIKLKPEWHSDDDNKGVIKVVMTGSSSDPEDMQPFVKSKPVRKLYEKRMKDVNDPLKIVIVRDMWLTGFDAPSMHTMYIDKPMQGHNLMQAIARVNRVFKDKPGGLIVDYIGIADSLKEALKQYTDSDKDNTGIDTDQAVDIMLEKHQLIRELLHGHDYSNYNAEKASLRMQAMINTMDYVMGLGEENKKRFLNLVVELGKAYALCSTTEEAVKINEEIGFFKAVKATIVKKLSERSGVTKTKDQLDYEINQLVSKSIISEDVIDVYKELGIENPDISILSDKFLEDVKALPQKNLAVALLNRLLAGKVKAIQRTNLIQARKFSEMLGDALNRYNKRTIETSKVIEELIQLAKEMDSAHKRGEHTGMIKEEVAFYDALASHETAEQVLGDDVLKAIAHELTKSIKENMSVDWNLRENARAKMRVVVRRLLKKYGYPPDLQKIAVDTVIEQAELMAEQMSWEL